MEQLQLHLIDVFSLIVLTLKSFSDLRYSKLIYFGQAKLLLVINALALVFPLIGIICFYSNSVSPSIQIPVFGIILICAMIKRRFKLYNSIEEIYESLLCLGLFVSTISRIASIFIFSIVLLSSISAGYSKLQSKLWNYYGSNGFLMFCTLPSISRSIIKYISVNIYFKPFIGKHIFFFLTFVTPYMQIVTGLFLLILNPETLLFKLSLFLQIIFIISLFVICDLSWITSIYLACVLNFAFIKNNLQISTVTSFEFCIIIIALIYCFQCLGLIFTPINSILWNSIRKYSLCSLGIGPFKMFTEAHMVNIITYFIDSKKLKGYNAFDQNGGRNCSQNFNSRHLQAAMYPFGDMIQLAYNTINSKERSLLPLSAISKSKLHLQQLEKLACIALDLPIYVFQHFFNDKTGIYDTFKVGKLIFIRSNCVYNVNLEFYYPLKPFDGR